jgi:hypothetical protein
MRFVIILDLQYASGAPGNQSGRRRETVVKGPGVSHSDLSGDVRTGRRRKCPRSERTKGGLTG